MAYDVFVYGSLYDRLNFKKYADCTKITQNRNYVYIIRQNEEIIIPYSAFARMEISQMEDSNQNDSECRC